MQVGVAEQWSGGQKVRGSGGQVWLLQVVSGQRSSKVWKTHNLILFKKKNRRGNGVIKTDAICRDANKAMTSASEQVHINLSF